MHKFKCKEKYVQFWRQDLTEPENTIPTVKYKGGTKFSLTGAIGAFHKINSILRKEHYAEIFI